MFLGIFCSYTLTIMQKETFCHRFYFDKQVLLCFLNSYSIHFEMTEIQKRISVFLVIFEMTEIHKRFPVTCFIFVQNPGAVMLPEFVFQSS